MKLGILYDGTKIVNHRSLFKVLLNPIFRYFGFHVGTKLKNDKLGWYKLNKCRRSKKIKWDFSNHNDYTKIVKKRTIL